jgi:aldose 1-epimerase
MSTVSTDDLPPSGEQHEIGYGDQRVVVTEIGATLRAFSVAGSDVIDGFDVSQQCSDGRGQVLAPWPNRLGGGRYVFDSTNGRAALDEPERNNAIHGLVRWLPWSLLGRAQNVVTLGVILHPQPAYPWRLSLTVEYRLGREGLIVTCQALNMGATPAPFGLGFHPYLTFGTATIENIRLLLPARRRLISDDRGLPTGEAEVAGSKFDFTEAKAVGSTALDTGFFDLARGEDKIVRAELSDPDSGKAVTLWADERFGYLMVYTADNVSDRDRRRRSIAVEPMTCPPDALRSGTALVRLAPHAGWRGSWGLELRSDERMS